eukprot:CAMPEP_0203669994 /NCGR_PEP_ID=MMETSP0090-20130426/6206_1 /ASSEMBLY_ACC=CAM_ASM_001088 /TAXON_ID=426623 /ORGANISM="Chaetoceros affinis, Strain CCMP159" /LENGTH=347 /DNA_ID=CAMNT_0050534763 /DNA_START=101 /DNA_END=1144 /DNA_ORIENTATION=+
MTFIGVTAMDIANVRAHYSPNPSSSSSSLSYDNEIQIPNNNGALSEVVQLSLSSSSDNQNFYDSSMTILFDLPNAIVVSTFVLLTLVWAECFLQSRFHTESMIQWKKKWLMGYTVFNSCLFSGQLIIYIFLLWPGTDESVKVVKGVIYAGMIATNLGACGIAAFSYFYLNIRFAGFPFKSMNVRQSLRKISIVFFIWSTSRLIWAIANITVFTYGIELLHDSDDPILSALVLFSLLLLCEILPMMIMLDYSYIQIVSFDRNSNGDDDNRSNSNISSCFGGSGSGSGNGNGNVNGAHDRLNSNQQDQYNVNTTYSTRGFWSNFSESLLSSSIQEEEEESISEPLIAPE